MSEPIRHHYTPKFYLSGWCSPGPAGEGDRLCVVENLGGVIVFFRRAPKAVGFQDYLYSFSEDVPADQRAALETKVFKLLDDKGKVLVTKLMADERLDTAERVFWATFLTAMRLRTPENITLLRGRGAEHVISELGKGQREYEALKELGDPETIVEWVETQYPGLIANFSLASIPRLVSGDIAVKINRMAWHSLDFGDGGHRLLSSDRPCVFTAGIDDPNCIVALPLSPRCAFIAFYPKSQAEAALTQHGPNVIRAALNKNVVTQAKQRAICFGERDAPQSFYRKYLVRQAANRS